MTDPMPFLISTRPLDKSTSFLKVRCLEVRNIPLTEIRGSGRNDSLEREIQSFHPESFGFTSTFGVKQFVEHYPDLLESFHGKIFAIGDRTGEAIEQAGFTAIIPDRKDSTGMAELIIQTVGKGERIALIRSKNADSVLLEMLIGAGIQARDYHIYEVAVSGEADRVIGAIELPGLIGIIVTSPMEAAILVGLAGTKLNRVPIYAIGSTTKKKLDDLGFTVSEPLGESNFEELVRKISKKHCK